MMFSEHFWSISAIKKTRDGRMDGQTNIRTDGQTNPLKELEITSF